MRGSENYVMTAHVESAGDMLELETVRKVVKVINSENADIEKWSKYRFENGYSNIEPKKLPRYRVKCQGRGPRASIARAEGRHPRAYDQSLPLGKAERWDVYVYQR